MLTLTRRTRYYAAFSVLLIGLLVLPACNFVGSGLGKGILISFIPGEAPAGLTFTYSGKTNILGGIYDDKQTPAKVLFGQAVTLLCTDPSCNGQYDLNPANVDASQYFQAFEAAAAPYVSDSTMDYVDCLLVGSQYRSADEYSQVGDGLAILLVCQGKSRYIPANLGPYVASGRSVDLNGAIVGLLLLENGNLNDTVYINVGYLAGHTRLGR
jgi:hypothetical protein